MVEIEIAKVKSVSFREINSGGERATEISGRDFAGCRFRITLKHNGRSGPLKASATAVSR